MKCIKQILLVGLLAGIMLLSTAAARSATLIASEKFVEDLRNGVPQELYVTFDADAINRDLARERVRRGLLHDDQQIVEESARRYAQLKTELFARPGMKAVRLISDYKSLPLVKVQISDLAGLALLLRQPMVTKLHEPFRIALSLKLNHVSNMDMNSDRLAAGYLNR